MDSLKFLRSFDVVIYNELSLKEFKKYCNYLPKGTKVEQHTGWHFSLTFSEKTTIKEAKDYCEKITRYYCNP